MRQINFSHRYFKMDGFDLSKPFKLASVAKTHFRDLTVGFIEQDTAYDGGHYQLPNTELLVLFLTQIGNEYGFTTVRRWTPEKEKYYRSLEGQQVMCVINDEKEAR